MLVAAMVGLDARSTMDLDATVKGANVNVEAVSYTHLNSMTELYTMQRYLQYERLQELDMTHFDCWASRFGETVTALELAPEGTGYRARTRFSKFFNLPELMNLFKEVADIKTADQLNPVSYTHLDVYKRQVQGSSHRQYHLRFDVPLWTGAGTLLRPRRFHGNL